MQNKACPLCAFFAAVLTIIVFTFSARCCRAWRDPGPAEREQEREVIALELTRELEFAVHGVLSMNFTLRTLEGESSRQTVAVSPQCAHYAQYPLQPNCKALFSLGFAVSARCFIH